MHKTSQPKPHNHFLKLCVLLAPLTSIFLIQIHIPKQFYRKRTNCAAIHLKDQHLPKSGKLTAPHSQVPAYQSLLVHKHLTNNGITVLPQPQYSSDLAHYYMFPGMKALLEGHTF
jgi:hypothetical protein